MVDRLSPETGLPLLGDTMSLPSAPVVDKRAIRAPESLPATRLPRIYTTSRPTSLPVTTAAANAADSRPHRRSLDDVYDDVPLFSPRPARGETSPSGVAISMDDVYAVDDVLARRRSIQPPAYSSNGYFGDSTNDKKVIDLELSRPPVQHRRTASAASATFTKTRQLGMASRIIWPLLLVLPLFTALGLAYFSTSQSVSIRQVVDVVRIKLPPREFRDLMGAASDELKPLMLGPGPLLGASEAMNKTDRPIHTTTSVTVASLTMTATSAAHATATLTPLAPSLPRRAGYSGPAVAGGLLGVGLWGWSLTPLDGNPIQVSDLQVWDQLDGLFPQFDSMTNQTSAASSTTLGYQDFPETLGKFLFLHSVGLLLIMIAVVPTLIYVARRHVKNNAYVDPGWLQHGSLLLATGTNLAAWIVDERYMAAVQSKASDRFQVSQGICPSITIAATCVVAAASLVSVLPILVNFLHRQQQRSRQWTNVMEVGSASGQPAQSAMTTRHGLLQMRRKLTSKRRTSVTGGRLQGTGTS